MQTEAYHDLEVAVFCGERGDDDTEARAEHREVEHQQRSERGDPCDVYICALKYEYKQTVGDEILRGYARKTVRNGYTVLLDYRVINRLPRGTDENYLNRIANTVEFETVTPGTGSGEGASAGTASETAASGLLQVTVAPPAETNTGEFTVEGHASPGAHLIGVAMRWSSSSTALRFTADATRAGNFKLKVTLPEEGVWLLTLNLEINDNIVAEEVFSTTVFSKTLLPVVMDADPPEQLTTDELTLSGTTSKGGTVQCYQNRRFDSDFLTAKAVAKKLL